MNTKQMLIALLVIGAGLAMVNSLNVVLASGGSMEKNPNATVVRDSFTVLGPKAILANDYLHLYDTTPYMIMNGHVAAKLPCDSNSETEIQILIGKAPNLKPAELEYIQELSTPGKLCLYHVDLVSEHGEDVDGGIITDVAVANPTDSRKYLPFGSSIVIGVNEIMPLEMEASFDD